MPKRTVNAIAHHRTARGLRQAQVARALRTDVPRVSQIEAGYMVPTTKELRQLCRVLKVKPSDLYSAKVLAMIAEE